VTLLVLGASLSQKKGVKISSTKFFFDVFVKSMFGQTIMDESDFEKIIFCAVVLSKINMYLVKIMNEIAFPSKAC
jgi:hypothetical protein